MTDSNLKSDSEDTTKDLRWLSDIAGLEATQDPPIRMAASEKIATLRVPDAGAREWRMEAEWRSPTGNGPAWIIGRHRYEGTIGARLSGASHINVLGTCGAASAHPAFPKNEWCTAQLVRKGGEISLKTSYGAAMSCVDPDPNRPIQDFLLRIPEGLEIRSFSLHTENRVAAHPRAKTRSSAKPLRSVTIDFFDDTLHGAWNSELVDQQMEIYRRDGIQRVYFIPTQPITDNFWNMRIPARPSHRQFILDTQKEIGDFLPAFCSAAKAHGLEFHAVYKPFEEAFDNAALPFDTATKDTGKYFTSLSGIVWWANDWIIRHPETRLRRRPEDLTVDQRCGPIHRIVLESEQPHTESGLSLWSSPNNRNYSRLECGEKRLDDHRTEFTLPGETSERFAIRREPSASGPFGNRLRDLVRCYDEAGQEVPISFGVTSDLARRLRKGAFPEISFAFDTNLAGQQLPIDRGSYWQFQEGQPIGVTRGYGITVTGTPCPAYSEVRQHWLTEIERCLDLGCDGVDIRVANHTRSFDWEAYGYNDVVLDELGANPSAADVRRCLGDHYTRFLHTARKLVTERHAKLHLHLEHSFNPCHQPCSNNIEFQWRKWLEAGLADEVTLMANSPFEGIFSEMSRTAKDLGIPANLRPYFNSINKGPFTMDSADQILRDLQISDTEGLNLYENHAFFRLNGNNLIAQAPDCWRKLLH